MRVEIIADLIDVNTDDPYHPYVTVKLKPVLITHPLSSPLPGTHECAMNALRRYFGEHVDSVMKVTPYNSALSPGSVTGFDFYKTEYEDGVEVDYVDISFTYPGGDEPSNNKFMFVVDAFSSSPEPEATSCYDVSDNWFEFYPFFIPYQPTIPKVVITGHSISDAECEDNDCTVSFRLRVTPVESGMVDITLNGQRWSIPAAEPGEEPVGWVDSWYSPDALVSARIWNFDPRTEERGPLSDPYVFVSSWPFRLNINSEERYEIWWDGELKGYTPLSFMASTGWHRVTIRKDGEIFCGCNGSNINPVLDPYEYDEYVTRFRVGLDEVEGNCVYAFHVTNSSHISLTVDIDKQTCAWVDIHGGKENIKMFDILDILGAYKGDVSIGFTPGLFDVMGAIAYYKGDRANGNKLTGCTE